MHRIEEGRAWWKEAVVYQVYPRSFADSDGDGVGDLNGITEHLPYIAGLGADVIWLCPVYASPNDDNGYDISDYRAIMGEFGTMDDFDRMLARAHELGLKIVMDLVVNHSSDEHAWFAESRSSRDNPYRDYYIWREPREGGAPNNWESFFSGPAWELDEATGMYYLHLFSKKQPDLNWDNPRVRDEVFDMMRWWCDKGIDGFRMDVISLISKDPALPDGPLKADGYGEAGPFVCNGPHVHEYLREMRSRVLADYDLMTVGEAAGVTIDEARRYANADGSELDMVFSFDHVDNANIGCETLVGKWGWGHPRMAAVRDVFERWQAGLEGFAWNSLYWSNHDQPRAVSRFGNDAPEWRERSAKMLATCLHLMKGTPYVYQGEELGMTNTHFSSLDDCRDLEELNAHRQLVEEQGLVASEELLRCFDAVGRDNARTPMQWDASPNAGFTTGAPWLAVNPNYREINVQAELADPDSVLNYYRRLIKLRHELPVIVYGSYRPLLGESETVWAYERALDGCVITVACNWTDCEQPCGLFDGPSYETLIGNYATHRDGVLQPYEAYATLRMDASPLDHH